MSEMAMNGEERTPRARAVSEAVGDYLSARAACHGGAVALRPCPQCKDSKPCGGWLRPATRKPWLLVCDKCGQAVFHKRRETPKG